MEKLSLKWNEFTANVKKSFQNLRKEEDFFDVTLIGDDFKHVTAHKLVLSANSQYFKNVFSNNKKYFQSNAMICLEGVNFNDLNNILDYVYQGEVQIQQDELDRFLVIAERLKLEGMIGGMQQKDFGKTDTFEEFLTPQNNIYESRNENQISRDFGINEKPLISIMSSEIQSLEELDLKVEGSFIKDLTGQYSCNHCKKQFKKRDHVREHVEIHFEGLSFPCTFCSTTLRTRKALRLHRSGHLKSEMQPFL